MTPAYCSETEKFLLSFRTAGLFFFSFFLIAILQDAEEGQSTGQTAADSFSQSFSEKRDSAGVVALHGFDC